LRLGAYTPYLVFVLAFIYSVILGTFHLSSILGIEVAMIWVFGLICGILGFMRSFPAAIYISILVQGTLILMYAIQDGNIINIIVISTMIVAFFYSQRFLRFVSRILQDIKGLKNTFHTREVARGHVFQVLIVSTLTILVSFILLNVSVYSSAGLTSVWTALLLAILFVFLVSLLIVIPRERTA
jgi:hypothetical protein